MTKETDRSVRNLKLRWQNEACYRYADQHRQTSISYRASSLQALDQKIEQLLQYGSSWSTVDTWLENRGYSHGDSTYGYSHGDNSYVLKALELKHAGSNGSDQIECSITVPPLEAVILENSQSQYDVYINACGPIWGTAYAPEVRCRRAHAPTAAAAERVVFEKHIAVGVTRIGFKDDDKNDDCCGAGSDSLHYVGEEESYDNLLEMWVVKGTIHSAVDDKVKTEVSNSRHVHQSIIKKRDPNVIVKKGRPRKYPLVEAEPVVNKSKVVNGSKVVRKRGRPRKDPIKEESVVVEEFQAVEEGISAEVKSMEEDSMDLKRNGNSKQRKKGVDRPEKQNNYALHVSDSESEGSVVYDSAAGEEYMDCDTNIVKGEQSASAPEEDEVDDTLPVPHHASLSYCVELNGRGPIWGLNWAPSWSESYYPSPSPTEEEDTDAANAAAALDKKSLGLLAAVCGDGCCLILLLPRDLCGSNNSYGSSPVIDEGDVKVTELRIPGVMVTCVAWSCHQPFMICCGMSDGSVTIWDIESSLHETDPLGMSPVMTLLDPQMDTSIPALFAISSVQFCPYHPHLVLCVALDGIMIWNLQDHHLPCHVRKYSCAKYCGKWDPCGYGYYFGESDSTALTWEPLWASSFKMIQRLSLYRHHHTYGGVWDIHTIRLAGESFIVTAASDGTIRCGFASSLIAWRSDQLLQLFSMTASSSRVMAVIDDHYSSTSAAAAVHRELRVTIQCVNSIQVLSTGLSSSIEAFTDSNRVALHCIDMVGVAPRSSNEVLRTTQLLAYGGAAGLLRVHSLNPVQHLR